MLLNPYPGLGASERPEGSPDFKFFAVFNGRHSQGIAAAIFRVQNLAALPHLAALGLFRATNDFKAEQGLTLAVIAAFGTKILGFGGLEQTLFNFPVQHACRLDDTHFSLGLAGLVIAVAPQAQRRALGQRRKRKGVGPKFEEVADRGSEIVMMST